MAENNGDFVVKNMEELLICLLLSFHLINLKKEIVLKSWHAWVNLLGSCFAWKWDNEYPQAKKGGICPKVINWCGLPSPLTPRMQFTYTKLTLLKYLNPFHVRGSFSVHGNKFANGKMSSKWGCRLNFSQIGWETRKIFVVKFSTVRWWLIGKKGQAENRSDFSWKFKQ